MSVNFLNQFVQQIQNENDNKIRVPALPEPVYKVELENKVWRIVKEIFYTIISVIIFPIGIYRLIHLIAAKTAILPASSPDLMQLFGGPSPEDLKNEWKKAQKDKEWKIERIAIEVDGYVIDAAIMRNNSSANKDRWVLRSNGNGEFYEHSLNDHNFKHIVSELDGNAIVFNYPGVGESSGMPSRSAMEKAYRAMLMYLEDKEKGLGAKEIIGYGHSIGGGVQGDALLSHELKEDINYVFVKSRTFSDLSSTASDMIGSPIIGTLVDMIGWNSRSVESSKNLKAPEIIMQTADCSKPIDLSKNPDLIVHDGVISAESSLAKALLEDGTEYENKYFMGIPESHNSSLYTSCDALTKKINEMLAKQKQAKVSA